MAAKPVKVFGACNGIFGFALKARGLQLLVKLQRVDDLGAVA